MAFFFFSLLLCYYTFTSTHLIPNQYRHIPSLIPGYFCKEGDTYLTTKLFWIDKFIYLFYLVTETDNSHDILVKVDVTKTSKTHILWD